MAAAGATRQVTSRTAGSAIRARRCRWRSILAGWAGGAPAGMPRSSQAADPVVRFRLATLARLNLSADATVCVGEAPTPGAAGVPPMRTRLVERARDGDDV